MLPFSINAGRTSLWQLLRDPQVRVGIYTWLIIAGVCVVLANVVAMSI